MSRVVRLIWGVFRGSASAERRKMSVMSVAQSYSNTYPPTVRSVAAERAAGALGAIGRFATRTLMFTPPVRRDLE